VDGYMAVMLWHEYKHTREQKTLDTLLAYNIEDVLTLEKLLVFAFNEKIKSTPFYESHRLEDPIQPPNPFRADPIILDKLKSKMFFGVY
jgi:hypothetical protein